MIFSENHFALFGMALVTKDKGMVDASGALEPAGLSFRLAAEQVRNATPEVTVASQGDLATYARICAKGIFAPAQSPEWVEAWVANCRPDFFIATFRAEGLDVLSLALEVTASGPFRIARFMGGSHANGNFPAADPDWLRSPMGFTPALLAKAIRRARPDVDMVSLERLAATQDGIANPLAAFPRSPSADPALASDLRAGFDALLEKMGGKRKRKKNRMQTRKFEAAGGFRRFQARTRDEVDALLGAFFSLKEERLRAKGIGNVFGAPAVRGFFRDLFSTASSQPNPAFVLHGLEIGGKLRAVTGSSRCGGRMIFEFGAIADDELASISPGEFLIFENIAEASSQGFAVYDFSVGDEPYKRTWCDLEVWHFDVMLPLTLKGRVYASGRRAAMRLKGAIKRNEVLWALVKKFRKRGAARAIPAED